MVIHQADVIRVVAQRCERRLIRRDPLERQRQALSLHQQRPRQPVVIAVIIDEQDHGWHRHGGIVVALDDPPDGALGGDHQLDGQAGHALDVIDNNGGGVCDGHGERAIHLCDGHDLVLPGHVGGNEPCDRGLDRVPIKIDIRHTVFVPQGLSDLRLADEPELAQDATDTPPVALLLGEGVLQLVLGDGVSLEQKFPESWCHVRVLLMKSVGERPSIRPTAAQAWGGYSRAARPASRVTPVRAITPCGGERDHCTRVSHKGLHSCDDPGEPRPRTSGRGMAGGSSVRLWRVSSPHADSSHLSVHFGCPLSATATVL